MKFHTRFSCGHCQAKFKQISRIEFHLKTCLPFEVIQCQYCDHQVVFKSQLDLCQHVSEKHQQVLKPFKCQLCDHAFKLRTSYRKHMSRIHEHIPCQSHQCDKCPKKFIKKVYLTNHQMRFHQLKKEQLCTDCGELFLTQDSLKKHKKQHNNPQLEFECHVCQKIFRRKDKVSTLEYKSCILQIHMVHFATLE